MKLHKLKEYTLYYILEHDNLTKAEKLHLGEFVKEANEDQINHLLLTGRPCGGKDAKVFVEKNPDLLAELGGFNRHFNIGVARSGDIAIHMGPKVTGAVAIGVGIGAIYAMISASYVIYKDYISKAGRKCRDLKLSTSGRTSCEAKARSEAYMKQAKALTGAIGECKKTRNPGMCQSKLKAKIAKLKMKAKKQNEKGMAAKFKARSGEQK